MAVFVFAASTAFIIGWVCYHIGFDNGFNLCKRIDDEYITKKLGTLK